MSYPIKITIISGLFSIFGALIQGFFGILPIHKECKSYSISSSGDGNIAMAGEYNNYTSIKQPLPLEIKDEKILKDNISKIQALFRYRNDKAYYNARNTIDTSISRLFTPEKVANFREQLTQIISITDIQQDGEIGNSEYLNYSKHFVYLNYGYKSKTYQELRNIVVERSEKDPTQHHITMFKCLEGNGPLCKNFSQ